MRDDESWNTEILTKHNNLWGRDLLQSEICGTDWPRYQVKNFFNSLWVKKCSMVIHAFVICSCEWALKKKGLKKKHLKGEYSIGKPQTLELHERLRLKVGPVSNAVWRHDHKSFVYQDSHVQRCKWGGLIHFQTNRKCSSFFFSYKTQAYWGGSYLVMNSLFRSDLICATCCTFECLCGWKQTLLFEINQNVFMFYFM